MGYIQASQGTIDRLGNPRDLGLREVRGHGQ